MNISAASTTTPLSSISPATLEPKLASAHAFTFGETKLPMLPIVFTIATLGARRVPPVATDPVAPDTERRA